MNTVELFCGTKSFSKVAKRFGHKTFTVDIDSSFNPDLCCDLSKSFLLPDNYDVLWASPPCTSFSVASIGRNWNKDGSPKSDNALFGLKLLDKTVWDIDLLKPRFWFVENPRGMMRKVIDKVFEKYGFTDYRRVTVTYCQYGDSRMKPTDIWTNNMKWIPKPACKNGDNCHVGAPRGSKTGTQGLKNARERAVIPEGLFIEMFEQGVFE